MRRRGVKHMNKLKLAGILSLAIVWSTCGQAAEMLLKSTPADGSIAEKPPSTFVLEFSEKVTLRELYLKRDDEKRWRPVGNLPYKEATAFTIAAPSLAAGGYILEWRVFVGDTKALTGRVRFTVSAEQPASTTSAEKPASTLTSAN